MFKINDITSNVVSGFVVAIVAIPMCFAIATASGYPTTSAIISSFISGGILAFVSGKNFLIKGAPAGLSPITLACIVAFGGGIINGDTKALQITGAAILLSGVLQIILGLTKGGNVAHFFPTSVIQGLLAALGLIIFIKQFPSLIGSFYSNAENFKYITDLNEIFFSSNFKVIIIGVFSFGLLYVTDRFPLKFYKIIPPILLVVILGVVLSLILQIEDQNFYAKSPSLGLDGIIFPSFEKILNFQFIQYVLLFAVVGGIESVLSVKAIEKIQVLEKDIDLNKDLIIVGAGNVLAGAIGGLPLITVSKRTLVNINSGGTNQVSHFFHALFIFAIIAFGSQWLSYIPIASLSSILLFSGYKLITPRQFLKTYELGKEQLFVYLGTIIGVFFTGIIPGIIIGIILQLVLQLKMGVQLKHLFKDDLVSKEIEDGILNIKINNAALFSNYHFIQNYIQRKRKNFKFLEIDLSSARLIDHSFMEQLNGFAMKLEKKNVSLIVKGLDYHRNMSNHPLASKVSTVRFVIGDRELAFENYAASHSIIFDSRIKTNCNWFESFSTLQNFILIGQKNFLRTINSTYNIETLDLRLKYQEDLAENDVSLGTINLNNHNIPDMIIKKDNHEDHINIPSQYKLIPKTISDSFDFYYDVYYKDDNDLVAINQLLDNLLIYAFLKEKNYNVEFVGNKIIVFSRLDRLKINEYLNLYEFMVALANNIIELKRKEDNSLNRPL